MTDEPEPLMNRAEAARRLGTTGTHVRLLVADKKLKCVWVGRYIRFHQEDLDAFIEENSSVVAP